ncbi:flavin reductase family protein [Streptomyces albus subsp. chlorinus]|uniref:flavin reductase family protein n=1 Tax=Streptomyces albus TaxID=1888 RepID=UPI00156D927B|nr:flavin reductase family protein [Streptomyces albus]NSC25471.1 flavin reductase family protein [Streptomyces albus subsp. chlorinus]
MEARPRANLLAALIVPRPIAWVTTTNSTGRTNAAPFSFFNLMSGTPPVLCIGMGARDGRPKDSARNIEETGEFVVNLVTDACAPLMNATAIDFDAEVDELAEVGIDTVPSALVKPPRVAASPVGLECALTQIVPIGAGQRIIIGQVLAVHVEDEYVRDADRGHIDTASLAPIGRLNGGWYARTTSRFHMPQVSESEWRSRGTATAGDPHDD